MSAVRRVSNWRFVDDGFRGAVPWTRFVVDPTPTALQLPILLDGEWPAGLEGPSVQVSQAWYDEFRYRVEHTLRLLYMRLVQAYSVKDDDEIEQLKSAVAIEERMVWDETRPILVRELLHEW